MPRPAYILFAESGSLDEFTNQVSAFNIVELIIVRKSIPDLPPFPSRQIKRKFRLIAAWIKDDGDTPDVVFQIQLSCFDQAGRAIYTSGIDSFSFTPDSYFHRYIASTVEFNGFPSLGEYSVEARLRRVGEQEWMVRQSFPFLVMEIPPIEEDSVAN